MHDERVKTPASFSKGQKFTPLTQTPSPHGVISVARNCGVHFQHWRGEGEEKWCSEKDVM